MRLRKLPVSLFAVTLLLVNVAVDAQQNAAALAGRWEGTYIPKTQRDRGASRELASNRGTTKQPVVVMITAADDGTLSGTWAIPGPQGPLPLQITIDGDTIRFTTETTTSSWEGKLSADGSKLDGKWQGKTFGGDATAPLVLSRSGS